MYCIQGQSSARKWMIVQLVSRWYHDSCSPVKSVTVRHPIVAGMHPAQVIGHWSVFQPWSISCELMNSVSVSCILVSAMYASRCANKGELSEQLSSTLPLSYTNNLCRTWYSALAGHGSGPWSLAHDAMPIAIAIVINLFMLLCVSFS